MIVKIPFRLVKRNYDLQIVLIVGLFVSILLLSLSEELGNILLTELISVSVTVFVIDNLLERKERRKRIAIDQRILREVQSVIASYFSIWKHLTWKFLPDQQIASGKDFIEIYSDLVRHSYVHHEFEIVSLEAPESWDLLYHRRSIKQCFQSYHDSMHKQIKTFITAYSTYIEPELFNLLLDLLECQYFRSIHLMNQPETQTVLIELEQDINRLDSYINENDHRHLEKIMQLMDYSEHLHTLINRFEVVKSELYEVGVQFRNPVRQE